MRAKRHNHHTASYDQDQNLTVYCHYYRPGLQPHLFTRWTWQTHLINSQGAIYESWMPRCSHRALGLIREQYACTNIQSKIKINGLQSDLFSLMQGVCQGCPLSLVLHIMAAEVLANFIDANKSIKGVQKGNHGIKLVNFAEYITIYVGDITCLNRIQVILKLYEEASSSKINF